MLMRPIARVPSRRRTSAAHTLRRAIAPLLALAAGAAVAFPIPTPDEPALQEPAPTAAIMQAGGVSLQQAIELALMRYPGRVVRTETTSRDGRRVHEIRIYVEGEGEPRMRIVRIDAENGRFL
jgi:hypothetical protein